LNLASNNYLGLADDARVKSAAIDAIERWGTGSGSSPLLSGFTSLHQELVDSLVTWKSGGVVELVREPSQLGIRTREMLGIPDLLRGVLFPCGYSANLAALTVLLESDAQVFADRKNHASLMDGLRMAQTDRPNLTVRYFRHRDFSDLARLLEQSSADRPRWIVTDSVFSMDGTCTRPSDLAELVARFDASLLVDEAHATGVMGQGGAGLFSFAELAADSRWWRDPSPRFCIVGTLSKALASLGGFLVGSAELVDRMIQAARPLVYSTSLPASNVAAALAAIQVANAEPWRRETVAGYTATLHHALKNQGWKTVGDLDAPLLGVVVGDHRAAEHMANELLEAGIWTPAIRPPTVKPLECRVRISPTATMAEGDIQAVINAFEPLARRLRQDGSYVF
jgi:8-amino-7-oxononanoate synthase